MESSESSSWSETSSVSSEINFDFIANFEPSLDTESHVNDQSVHAENSQSSFDSELSAHVGPLDDVLLAIPSSSSSSSEDEDSPPSPRPVLTTSSSSSSEIENQRSSDVHKEDSFSIEQPIESDHLSNLDHEDSSSSTLNSDDDDNNKNKNKNNSASPRVDQSSSPDLSSPQRGCDSPPLSTDASFSTLSSSHSIPPPAQSPKLRFAELADQGSSSPSHTPSPRADDDRNSSPSSLPPLADRTPSSPTSPPLSPSPAADAELSASASTDYVIEDLDHDSQPDAAVSLAASLANPPSPFPPSPVRESPSSSSCSTDYTIENIDSDPRSTSPPSPPPADAQAPPASAAQQRVAEESQPPLPDPLPAKKRTQAKKSASTTVKAPKRINPDKKKPLEPRPAAPAARKNSPPRIKKTTSRRSRSGEQPLTMCPTPSGEPITSFVEPELVPPAPAKKSSGSHKIHKHKETKDGRPKPLKTRSHSREDDPAADHHQHQHQHQQQQQHHHHHHQDQQPHPHHHHHHHHHHQKQHPNEGETDDVAPVVPETPKRAGKSRSKSRESHPTPIEDFAAAQPAPDASSPRGDSSVVPPLSPVPLPGPDARPASAAEDGSRSSRKKSSYSKSGELDPTATAKPGSYVRLHKSRGDPLSSSSGMLPSKKVTPARRSAVVRGTDNVAEVADMPAPRPVRHLRGGTAAARSSSSPNAGNDSMSRSRRDKIQRLPSVEGHGFRRRKSLNSQTLLMETFHLELSATHPESSSGASGLTSYQARLSALLALPSFTQVLLNKIACCPSFDANPLTRQFYPAGLVACLWEANLLANLVTSVLTLEFSDPKKISKELFLRETSAATVLGNGILFFFGYPVIQELLDDILQEWARNPKLLYQSEDSVHIGVRRVALRFFESIKVLPQPILFTLFEFSRILILHSDDQLSDVTAVSRVVASLMFLRWLCPYLLLKMPEILSGCTGTEQSDARRSFLSFIKALQSMASYGVEIADGTPAADADSSSHSLSDLTLKFNRYCLKLCSAFKKTRPPVQLPSPHVQLCLKSFFSYLTVNRDSFLLLSKSTLPEVHHNDFVNILTEFNSNMK